VRAGAGLKAKLFVAGLPKLSVKAAGAILKFKVNI